MSNSLKASEYMPTTQSQRTQEVQESLKVVRNALFSIQKIIRLPQAHSRDDFEKSLGEISHFFRTAKFSKVIVPVLEGLVQDDRDSWEDAFDFETQDPITPNGFGNFPKSTAEVKENGLVLHPAQREREIQLLKVYGITLETLHRAYSLLGKNN